MHSFQILPKVTFWLFWGGALCQSYGELNILPVVDNILNNLSLEKEIGQKKDKLMTNPNLTKWVDAISFSFDNLIAIHVNDHTLKNWLHF